VAWNQFNTKCWNNSGATYAGQPLQGVAVVVPGENVRSVPYDFCINGISLQGQTSPPSSEAPPAAPATGQAPSGVPASAGPPLGDDEANRRIASVMGSDFETGAHARAEMALIELLMACANACRAAVNASIWMHIGVVRGVGLHNQKKALDAFVLGLRLDGNATPPVIYLDSATLASFQKARKQVSSQ
jgi:hypothetical protein